MIFVRKTLNQYSGNLENDNTCDFINKILNINIFDENQNSISNLDINDKI